MPNLEAPPRLARRWIIALLFSFAFLTAVSFFHWEFINWSGLLGPVPLHLLFAAIPFAGCVIWSLNYTRHFRARGVVAIGPAIFSLIAIAFLVMAPFSQWWLKWNFYWHLDQRERVVELVRQGKLKPLKKDIVELGNEFPRVSAGGNDIIVRETNGRMYVLFFVYRGILGRYSGYLYAPADGSVNEFRSIVGDRDRPHGKIEGNWHFLWQ